MGMPIAGRYCLRQRVGRGPAGTVYLADDPFLERRVAVKILHARVAEHRAFVSRLREEARLLARLDHPHCVRIFDLVECEGRPALVTEYVAGASLRDILRSQQARRLPLEQAVGVMGHALSGLQGLHEQGVLHLNLKPENILCTPDGIAKVSDAGLAVAVPPASGRGGPSPRSIRYMSPEQAEGSPCDVRTDVYSCGAVLYEMLTRRPPVDARLTPPRLGRLVDVSGGRRSAPRPPDTIAELLFRPGSVSKFDSFDSGEASRSV